MNEVARTVEAVQELDANGNVLTETVTTTVTRKADKAEPKTGMYI